MAKLASMTGFARADGTLPDGASFLWEVRSVNGRGLDLRLRLPNGFDTVEPALRASGDAVGRRLEFLTQEFVREANTLCSKSATVALTRLGLDLKAAIERLREQAANVE